MNKVDILLVIPPALDPVKWKSKGGENTHEIRKERMLRAYDAIKDCGIEISRSVIKGLI